MPTVEEAMGLVFGVSELTVIRRTHRVVETLQPTEFPFKLLRVFVRKRSYLVNRR